MPLTLNDIDAAAIDSTPETDWLEYASWLMDQVARDEAEPLDLTDEAYALARADELMARWGTTEAPF